VQPDGKTLDPLIVKTGITDGSYTEITEGLSEGKRLVIANQTASTGNVAFGGPPPGGP